VRRKCIIIGIDEAGRGPLAGPIAVAGIATTVIGPANSKFSRLTAGPRQRRWQIPNSKQNLKFKIKNLKFLKEIKDSKKLSAKQRKEWAAILCKKFECHCAMVGPKVIDRIGIQKATRLAVSRVLRKFSFTRFTRSRPSRIQLRILLDGSLFAPKHYNQETIIKGDEKIPLIAAASIIAKETRDAKMLRLHKKFPQYCFDKHKGYGTKLHYKMLKKYGLSPFHRQSFCKNFKFKIR